MGYKPPVVEIPTDPHDDPYKNDLLNTCKGNGQTLTSFVGSLKEPFVLAIDSPWGTGKTTFLRMWVQDLRNRGFCCFYFNAWENDFSESPLVSLIGEFDTSIQELSNEKKTAAAEVLEKTKKLGASLVKIALPTAVKLVTAGAVDIAEISNLAENLAKKQIEKYEVDKNSIRNFRDQLSNLVTKLAKSDSENDKKPLVFVIDELDRCRPDYAIELLEKLKHLFNVPGLVFVLAVDKQQLGESAKSLYGPRMNSDGYLRRFIDLDYRLPIPPDGYFVDAMFARLDLHNLLPSCHSELEKLRQTLRELFTVFGFSLRTQEQIFTRLMVIIRILPPQRRINPECLGFLLSLRTYDYDLYMKYVKDPLSWFSVNWKSEAGLLESGASCFV